MSSAPEIQATVCSKEHAVAFLVPAVASRIGKVPAMPDRGLFLGQSLGAELGLQEDDYQYSRELSRPAISERQVKLAAIKKNQQPMSPLPVAIANNITSSSLRNGSAGASPCQISCHLLQILAKSFSDSVDFDDTQHLAAAKKLDLTINL